MNKASHIGIVIRENRCVVNTAEAANSVSDLYTSLRKTLETAEGIIATTIRIFLISCAKGRI